ncbi:MAG: GH3 auxin-responsive promoter family protein [Thaumarchaeota archaeon]|nr:GH3 auxin-responsive promoter family protein [Nitrososphaerota archaeon]
MIQTHPEFESLLTPFLKPNGEKKTEELLRRKLSQLSGCEIGRKLGASNGRLEELPLTTYAFYQPFYENPQPSAFMAPIETYIKTMTSGSQGKPKWYLQQAALFKDSAQTFAAVLTLSTFDGEQLTAKPGDVLFAMAAPKPFAGAFMVEHFVQNYHKLFKMIPETPLDPANQVMQMVQRSREVSIVFLPLPILMNMVLPRVRDLRLKGYLTMDTSAGYLADEIKKTLGARPTTSYASTETSMVAIPSLEYTMGFILDQTKCFFEFIPEKKSLAADGDRISGVETLRISEVEKGSRYQLVATPFSSEITRYLTSDIFECLADGDSILSVDQPVFKFASRVGTDIALHNFTRINEGELITALKTAGIKHVDFTARWEASGSLEYMTLYIETEETTSKQEVEDTIHQKLLEMDRDYAMLSRLFAYKPLRVTLLSKGTFAKYLGERTGTIKPERLAMKQENFQRLLNISETMK